MCGIVGYIGPRPLVDTLIRGLKQLEYRGYDSAGLAVLDEDRIRILKDKGKVNDLQELVRKHWPEIKNSDTHVGIAHTRWATHGAPTLLNAHPHLDDSQNFAVVHNGIIENYASLKENLTSLGHKFVSDTDSEVIAHLIAEMYEGNFLKAVAATIKQLQGTFGIAVIAKDHPDSIIAARRGSPIILGIGENEMIVASDVAALVSYTKRVIYLEDDDIVLINQDKFDIRNVDNVPVSRKTGLIDWDVKAAEKGGFDHFTLKEIFEQPEAVRNSFRGRLDIDQGTAVLNGLNFTPKELAEISSIIIAACGTSLHAGMMGDYYFEDLANIPTEIEQAAEFRYRNPIIRPQTLVIAISQSGETADTLAAAREAKQKGAIVAGLCNVVGSTIARETGRGIYIHAGPEIGVASTKAFTCQVMVLLMMALKFSRVRRLSRHEGIRYTEEIQEIPDLIQKVLDTAPQIEKIAKKYAEARDFFFIGRGPMYPIALEGALKLKEISYIHAEGYHAAELKHGPIALLDENVPVVALAINIPGKDKIISNIQECRARKSPVIAAATLGDQDINTYANDVLWIPPCSRFIAPIPTVVALQLLSYYIAKERGCPIDQPKNLAKSVTVE
jgi:glutamine---fructose-6-phosphate transaminase (isomerizing)